MNCPYQLSTTCTIEMKDSKNMNYIYIIWIIYMKYIKWNSSINFNYLRPNQMQIHISRFTKIFSEILLTKYTLNMAVSKYQLVNISLVCLTCWSWLAERHSLAFGRFGVCWLFTLRLDRERFSTLLEIQSRGSSRRRQTQVSEYFQNRLFITCS